MCIRDSSNTGIYAQVIDDVAGVTLASASTLDKEVSKGTKTEQAVAVGKLVAERANAKGISEAVSYTHLDVYKRQSLDFAEITTSTPEKSLLVALKSKAGRNNNGRITVRHQGGGHKRFYRLVDFKRNKDNVEAVVKTIEYDPNRSANIALVHLSLIHI